MDGPPQFLSVMTRPGHVRLGRLSLGSGGGGVERVEDPRVHGSVPTSAGCLDDPAVEVLAEPDVDVLRLLVDRHAASIGQRWIRYDSVMKNWHEDLRAAARSLASKPDATGMATAALDVIDHHAPAQNPYGGERALCAAGCHDGWPCPTILGLANAYTTRTRPAEPREWKLCVGGPWHGRYVLAMGRTMIVPSLSEPTDSVYELRAIGASGRSREVYVHQSLRFYGSNPSVSARVAVDRIGRVLIDHWMATGLDGNDHPARLRSAIGYVVTDLDGADRGDD